MKIAALFLNGKIVTGSNHGEAFSKFSAKEKQSEDIISGFFDPNSLEFISDNKIVNKSIFMLRHAETLGNSIDPELSETGREICYKISYKFESNIEVFTSPMLRCLQTTQILQEKYQFKVTVMPELYEMLMEYSPDFLPNRKKDFPEFNWPEEEKMYIKKELPHEFFLRVKTLVDKLPLYSLLITHHGVIKNICDIVTRTKKERSFEMASLTSVCEGSSIVSTLNCP